MKTLTIKHLKRLNACNSGLIKFKNTPELHNINI